MFMYMSTSAVLLSSVGNISITVHWARLTRPSKKYIYNWETSRKKAGTSALYSWSISGVLRYSRS